MSHDINKTVHGQRTSILKCGGIRGRPSYHGLEQRRYPHFSDSIYLGASSIECGLAAGNLSMNRCV